MNREDKLDITVGRKLLRANALEAEVQSAIIDYLTTQGFPFTRSDATQSFTHKGNQVSRVVEGWPDITACLPQGRLFAIECKRGVGGILSYEQATTLGRIACIGGLICIARSVDDVVEVLMKGNREQDATEIAKALAKGPDVKALLRRRVRNMRRKNERRAIHG